jgi:tetratricopeptide (TPR) repeat protein
VDRNATSTQLDSSAILRGPGEHPTLVDEAPPVRIDRFTVIEQLGRGGMGVVHAAYDPQLDRRVALKLLRPDRWAAGDERARARVLAEARAMAKVSDPHVVTVFEVGSFGDAIFVAMEFVEGETVRQWLRDAPRGWREIVDVFVQLARGVAAVHAAGLVHRDIKLDNMMLRRDGRAQILDFGVAQDIGPAGSGEPAGSTTGHTIDRGGLVGTPSYMAPEQFAGSPSDARSDQWALSISLYEALYGMRPFDGDNLTELAIAICDAKLPAPPRGRDVPAAVHAVLVRGLAARPDERWPSIRGWLAALESASGRRRHRTIAITAASALVVALAVSVPIALREEECRGAAEALTRVWSPARSQTIGDVFASAVPSYGAESWQRTTAIVDAWGDSWTAARRDACEAERTELQTSHVHDLRAYCLERRLGQLDALLGVLEHADADVVEHSVDAAAQLDGVATCSDVTALLAGVAPPLPDQADDVAALERQIETASAAFTLTQIHAAAEALAGVGERVEALGYQPQLARFRFMQALIDEALGHDVEADRGMRRTYFLARSVGDHDLAGQAAAQYASMVVGRDANVELGELWLELAAAELGEGPSEATVRLHDARARLLHTQGRYDEAIAVWESALTEIEATEMPGVVRAVDRGTMVNNIAVALISLRRGPEAVEQARTAVAMDEQTHGPGHPGVATALSTLGTALELVGDYPGAIAVLRRGLEIRERALGPDHPLVATVLVQLATPVEASDHEQARALCERGLAILERAGRARSSEAALCLNTIAWTLYTDHDERGARDYFARALAVQEELLGSDHPGLGAPLSNLGGSEMRLGELAQAEAHLRRAIAVQEAALGPDAGGLGFALANLGSTLMMSGRHAEGIEVLERAVAHQLTDESPPEAIASAQFKLARAIATTGGDLQRARELAEQARTGFRRAHPVRTEEIAKVDAWEATLR